MTKTPVSNRTRACVCGPNKTECLVDLSPALQQRCVRGADGREVAFAAAAGTILPISGRVHGGNRGEAGCHEEGGGCARGGDDAVAIHARPSEAEH